MLKEIPVEGEILTRDEVAKLLKCTPRTVINMEKDGRLLKPFYMGDRTPRWRREDLMAWIERLAKPSLAASQN